MTSYSLLSFYTILTVYYTEKLHSKKTWTNLECIFGSVGSLESTLSVRNAFSNSTIWYTHGRKIKGFVGMAKWPTMPWLIHDQLWLDLWPNEIVGMVAILDFTSMDTQLGVTLHSLSTPPGKEQWVCAWLVPHVATICSLVLGWSSTWFLITLILI